MDGDALALAELAEISADESAALSRARGRAGQEIAVPSPPAGALLAWIAGLVGARAVVESGGAAGVTGLWLLRGMDERGTLTSIEHDPRAQEVAANAFEDEGVTQRVRSILGDPLEVLDRLSDGGYDLFVLQSVPSGSKEYLAHALRLLRPDGMLVIRGLAGGRLHESRARRDFARELVEHELFSSVIVPIDGGIALARRLEGDAEDPSEDGAGT